MEDPEGQIGRDVAQGKGDEGRVHCEAERGCEMDEHPPVAPALAVVDQPEREGCRVLGPEAPGRAYVVVMDGMMAEACGKIIREHAMNMSQNFA